MSKPKIIKPGNDLDCVHHEHIDGALVGTCLKCGQVKDYRRIMTADLDPAMKTMHGDATLEQVQESKSRGGKSSQEVRRRGSADENSAAYRTWSDTLRPWDKSQEI